MHICSVADKCITHKWAPATMESKPIIAREGLSVVVAPAGPTLEYDLQMKLYTNKKANSKAASYLCMDCKDTLKRHGHSAVRHKPKRNSASLDTRKTSQNRRVAYFGPWSCYQETLGCKQHGSSHMATTLSSPTSLGPITNKIFRDMETT